MALEAQDNPYPSVLFAEHVDPANPSAGTQRLFVDTDHVLKLIDSAGTVTELSSIVGAAAHIADTTAAHAASSIGFTPNGSIAATDVQAAIQEVRDEASAGGGMATDALWDATGDLAIGTGANTAAKLAIGSSGNVLTVTGGTPAWAAPAAGAIVPPPVIADYATGTGTTSAAATIAAAASGKRLVVFCRTTTADVSAISCTNVTFTEVLAVAFSTALYLSVYVGVVAGGSSGTTLTVTASGAGATYAEVIQVSDALTPTAGTSATLNNTDALNQQGDTTCRITPAAGTFLLYAAIQTPNTTGIQANILGTPWTSRRPSTFGAAGLCWGIAYGTGGQIVAYTNMGTAASDYAAGIVSVT